MTRRSRREIERELNDLTNTGLGGYETLEDYWADVWEAEISDEKPLPPEHDIEQVLNG